MLMINPWQTFQLFWSRNLFTNAWWLELYKILYLSSVTKVHCIERMFHLSMVVRTYVPYCILIALSLMPCNPGQHSALTQRCPEKSKLGNTVSLAIWICWGVVSQNKNNKIIIQGLWCLFSLYRQLNHQFLVGKTKYLYALKG